MLNRRLDWLLPLVFVLLCGPLGLFMALEVPLGQVADESNHALKADSLLQGEFFGHRKVIPLVDGTSGPQQGVDADFAVQNVSWFPTATHKLLQAHVAGAETMPWGAEGFAALGPIAGYFPIFYLPAATGLGLTKAVGGSPLHAFFVARLLNLLVYLVGGTGALILTRRGQALLFCTLSVPMSLNLAASLNHDGLLIAASVLAVALLTRVDAGPRDAAAQWRETPRLWATVLIACVVLAKPPYLPMAGLLLLPFPPLRFGSAWAGRLGLAGVVLVGALAWTWITVHFVSTSVVRPPAEAGPLWPGPRPAIFAGTDMAGQMQVLLAKPVRFLTLPWHTLMHEGFMVDQAIGVLGYLDLVLPPWIYRLWTWAALSAVAADLLWRGERASVLPAWQIVLPLLFAAAAVVAIYLSQYLAWTEVGGSRVEGPQGRYFLPLIPLVAFVLPRFAVSPVLGLSFRLLPVAASLASLAAVPGVIVRFYFMQ